MQIKNLIPNYGQCEAQVPNMNTGKQETDLGFLPM